MDTNMSSLVSNFDQCPVPCRFYSHLEEERKLNDVFCTICSSLFALALFICCCASFNKYNLIKMTYYTDVAGNTCGFDLPEYPLVYFTSTNDPSKRLCVSSCPKTGDTLLQCHPTLNLACAQNNNQQFQVEIYDSYSVLNRIGYICMPTDQDSFNKISQISKLQGKYQFLTIYDSIWTSLWISIVLGVLLIIGIQFCSRKIVHWTFILGSLTFIGIGIVCFIVPQGFLLFKILGGLVFIFMGCITAASYLKDNYRKQIFVCGRLFQIATQIIKQWPCILLYILLWWVLQFGLIVLSIFQLLSSWSIGPLYFDPNYPFYSVGSFISNILSFLIFVQFIWGLSFLKQSFNFCVGGYATLWYCFRANDPQKIKILYNFKILFKYHWGSVVGGSLLLWLFYFIDLFIDFFFSSDNQVNKNIVRPTTFTGKTLERAGFRAFFDLIRSQSFSYINLIPIPYCNASRYCEMLANDSNFYDRSQTTNRLYRLSAHIVIIMMATLIAFGANSHINNSSQPNIVGVLFVVIVSLFSVTYFISMHGDLAEGILERLNGMNNGSQLTRPISAVKNLHNDDLNEIYDKAAILEYIKGHLNNQLQSSN